MFVWLDVETWPYPAGCMVMSFGERWPIATGLLIFVIQQALFAVADRYFRWIRDPSNDPLPEMGTAPIGEGWPRPFSMLRLMRITSVLMLLVSVWMQFERF